MKASVIRFLALLLALLTLCVGFASCKAASKDSAEDYVQNEAEKGEIAPGATGGLADSEQTVTVPSDSERKIIKTYEISSETKEFDTALTTLNTLVADCGGYVERSSTSNKSLNNRSDSYTRYASYTIRVPAERAEEFVGSVGTLFNVTSNNSYVEDVSETYYAISARLEELQAERDSLIDILGQSDTKQDYDLWLTVTQRLSEVRQQIAVYQGQINSYDSKVAYSTIKLSINEVINYSSVSESSSFGSRFAAACREGWSNFGVGLQDFVIWFAEALPVLLLLALITTVILLIIRAVRKRRKKNHS